MFTIYLVGNITTSGAPTIKEGLGSHKLGVYHLVSNLGTTEGRISEHVCAIHADDD